MNRNLLNTSCKDDLTISREIPRKIKYNILYTNIGNCDIDINMKITYRHNSQEQWVFFSAFSLSERSLLRIKVDCNQCSNSVQIVFTGFHLVIKSC